MLAITKCTGATSFLGYLRFHFAPPKTRSLSLWRVRKSRSGSEKFRKCAGIAVNWSMAPIHAFGSFRLDVEAEILFRDGESLPVGRRGVALLRALVERSG